MFGSDFIELALIRGPIILFSLTVHEYYHAKIAYRFGDTTARDMGRLSLNPFVHLDLIGTLMMVVTQFRFGWAKPVPVNPARFRNRRMGQFWVSAAGPLSNIGLAVVAGMIYRTVHTIEIGLPPIYIRFLTDAVMINLILALFNLIPLFPLDGSHIFKSLVPREYESALIRFDRIAPFVLILLFVSGIVWAFLWPPIAFLKDMILGS